MASGDILSLTIRDTTPIDPDAAGIGASGDGWVAELLIEGGDAGMAFDAGRIDLTVEDPGFDATGVAVTRTRAIRGGARIRRQWPHNGETVALVEDGAVRILFSLDDVIYAGSTIVAAVIEASAYDGAVVGAIDPGRIANHSTCAYSKPLGGFLNLPMERAVGGSLAVEYVAYHRHAMAGRQVACVAFEAVDAAGHRGATVIAALPALSDMLTGETRPEAYKAAVPLAGLDLAVAATVTARVYPWIGDASAVLDLEETGISWPSASPYQPLPFCNDAEGSYGGAVAFVRPGASTGVVSKDMAIARAAPFGTISAAMAAIKTFNNTASAGHGSLHADVGGATLYLMDDGAGGAVAHALDTSVDSAGYGLCWLDVRVDPLAAGAVTMVNPSTFYTWPHLTRFAVPLVNGAGAFMLYLSGGPADNMMIAFDEAAISDDGGQYNIIASQYQGFNLVYHRNCAWHLTGAVDMLAIPANQRVQHAYVCGNRVVGTDKDISTGRAFVVGNDFVRVTASENQQPPSDDIDGMVIANNRFGDMRIAATIGYAKDYARGLALVQNVFECTSAVGVQIAADASIRSIDNFVEHHNLVLHERSNRLYADVAGTAVPPNGTIKRGTARFNIWHDLNCKQETFLPESEGTGRTGNWEYAYDVGCLGNVSLTGDRAGFATPDPSGEHYLKNHWEPGSVPSVAAAGLSVAFVDDRSGPAGGGGGDYRLTGADNAAFARVPAGAAVLGYDLGGMRRRKDGTGAAGPYEREAETSLVAPAGGWSPTSGMALVAGHAAAFVAPAAGRLPVVASGPSLTPASKAGPGHVVAILPDDRVMRVRAD